MNAALDYAKHELFLQKISNCLPFCYQHTVAPNFKQIISIWATSNSPPVGIFSHNEDEEDIYLDWPLVKKKDNQVQTIVTNLSNEKKILLIPVVKTQLFAKIHTLSNKEKLTPKCCEKLTNALDISHLVPSKQQALKDIIFKYHKIFFL